MAAPKLLLVGDNLKVKEFRAALLKSGAGAVMTVPETADALAVGRREAPDGIVFILPVYWESVSDFVAKLRAEPTLAAVPIIYFGDFIEANDQVRVKAQGVHPMTLGPVPLSESVRFILSLV